MIKIEKNMPKLYLQKEMGKKQKLMADAVGQRTNGNIV